MIRKSVFYLCCLLVFVSCEKEKYVAEFSYTVNGETITVKGGGLGYAEYFYADTLYNVTYRPMLYGDLPKNHGKKAVLRDTTQSYGFVLYDNIGGRQSHFDMQNLDEVDYFCLTYKGNTYWAISGFVDLKKGNSKKAEDMEIRGKFEAVMVCYPNDLPTDTIIVKNGSFYFSHILYSSGRQD